MALSLWFSGVWGNAPTYAASFTLLYNFDKITKQEHGMLASKERGIIPDPLKGDQQ